MSQFYYGVESISEIKLLAKKVVEVLGGGKDAEKLLIENSAVESRCGQYPDDNPESKGVGHTQVDAICLLDVQQEGEQRHFDLVAKHFGYDIKSLKLAYLAFDPLLALIITRLAYKRIPEPIPKTVFSRALYWKKYYNTEAGKGTPEHYIDSVAEVLGEEW